MTADDSVEAELREMAAEEIEPLINKRDRLANDVLRFMIPPDPTDSRNSVMEIRGGAGGDENQYLCWRSLPHVYQVCGNAWLAGGDHELKPS